MLLWVVMLLFAAESSMAQTVDITAPADNSSSPSGASIRIVASPTGTFNRVRFRQNGAIISAVSAAPWEATFVPPVNGQYVFTAELLKVGAVVAESDPVTVNVGPGGGGSNMAPSANFAFTVAGLATSFTDSSSDADGTISSRSWNFGDGGTSAATNPSHTYATGGTYTVQLNVTDNLGATGTVSKQVVVSSGGGGGSGGSGPTSITRSFVYDSAQRLCKVVDPEAGATVYEYDGAGNVLWVATGTTYTALTCDDRSSVPLGLRAARTIDSMNRVTRIATPNGDSDLLVDYEFDGQVKKFTSTNPGGVSVITSYTYDRRRNLTSETLTQPGWTSRAINYAYSPNAYLSTTTYPTGLVVDYSPDARGRATKAGTYATAVTYYPNGGVKQFTYGNGIVHYTTQNTRLRPSVSEDRYGSGAPVVKYSYEYDPAGNVSKITDGTAGATGTRTMNYDGRDRLTSTLWSLGNSQFTYDVLDNLRTSSFGASARSYDYDPSNRLAAATRVGGSTYTYTTDIRGNVLSDGNQGYVFDSSNRLNQVNDLSQTMKESYRYDGLARRVLSSRPGGVSTFWQYSRQGLPLLRIDSDTNKNRNNIYLNGSMVAAVDQVGTQSTTFYFHTDALGSPVAVTNSVRSVVETTLYTPYGAPIQHPVDGVGYSGHIQDLATNLTYMQQRYYDPLVGRFLSVDPVAVTPLNFNRYWYANNNPYRFTDPDGRAASVKDGRVWIAPEDKTVPAVNLPNNVGAVGFGPSDNHFHTYNVVTPSHLTGKQAGDGFKNNPTPGNDSAASPKGTRNDVGPIPTTDGTNIVRSYSIPSPDPKKYSDITVNYTVAGEHALTEGFVMRYGEINADGTTTLRSYGEGNNWRQDPVLRDLPFLGWGAKGEEVWQQNAQEIISGAK